MHEDYDSMSIEELEAVNIQLSSERSALRREQLRINEIMSRKIAERDFGLEQHQVRAVNVATVEGKDEAE